MIFAAVVGTRGRLTVPREALKQFGLRPTDRLRFTIQPDGSVIVQVERHRSYGPSSGPASKR